MLNRIAVFSEGIFLKLLPHKAEKKYPFILSLAPLSEESDKRSDPSRYYNSESTSHTFSCSPVKQFVLKHKDVSR